MTKTEKVNFVIKTLKDFYPEIPIPLDHKDPYTLLIAVKYNFVLFVFENNTFL